MFWDLTKGPLEPVAGSLPTKLRALLFAKMCVQYFRKKKRLPRWEAVHERALSLRKDVITSRLVQCPGLCNSLSQFGCVS